MPRPPTSGRRARVVGGVTAQQWAESLGEVTSTALRRAQAILAGTTEPGPQELVRVADHTGVDLGELTRALAALRGYLAPEAAAGDPPEG